VPADFERAAAICAAPDRIDADIKDVHRWPPEAEGEPQAITNHQVRPASCRHCGPGRPSTLVAGGQSGKAEHVKQFAAGGSYGDGKPT